MREELLALVAGRSGMVFAPNRHVEADNGIARAMERAGAGGPDAYLALVQSDPAALDALVDQLAVGETHFMRDPAQMDLVRREVLPEVQRRRGVGGAPRVWSAGCATGEEAYSLAILMEEAGVGADTLVLGTDFSATALQKARAGSYSDWSMRGVSSQFLEDYFRHVVRRRILVERIRRRVRFERLNLAGSDDYTVAGAAGMDLILCRNVLIYFDLPTVARIAGRLFDCLAEGGVLLTAGADPMLGEHAPFEVDVTRVGLVYRRPRRAPARVAARVAARMAAVPPRSRHPDVADAPAPAAPEKPAQAPVPAEADPDREVFLRVMGHANAHGAEDAERMAEAVLRLHPLDAPLHYLRAVLLLALDRAGEAEQEAERALYLDRSLAIAHFLLGTILRKRGARPGALRAFRNARDLCAARPSDEKVPAGAGERVGALRSAASFEMSRLEAHVD